MKTVDAFVGDYTEALLKNPQATVYENLAPIIRQAMQQAREQALTQAEEIYAEAHSWDYFKEAALAIRALKNKGA